MRDGHRERMGAGSTGSPSVLGGITSVCPGEVVQGLAPLLMPAWSPQVWSPTPMTQPCHLR